MKSIIFSTFSAVDRGHLETVNIEGIKGIHFKEKTNPIHAVRARVHQLNFEANAIIKKVINAAFPTIDLSEFQAMNINTASGTPVVDFKSMREAILNGSRGSSRKNKSISKPSSDNKSG